MNTFKIIIFLTTIFLVLSCKGNPDSYVEEGIRFMNSGQYTEAAVRFKTALKKDPKHFKATFALGVLYKRVDKLDKALTYLTKANSYNPKDEEAAAALSYVFIKKKQYDTAIRVLMPLSDAPKNPEILFYLGDANHKKGNYEQALKWLKRCINMLTVNDKVLLKDSYALIGDSYLALNKLDEAKEFLQSAANTNKNPIVLVKLGATLFRMANHFHVKALTSQNSIESINEKAEEIRNKRKKKAFLKENEEKLVSLKKEKEGFSQKRDELLSDSKRYLMEALKLSKKDLAGQKVTKREIHYYLGMTYILLKDYKLAKKNLETFLRNGPKGPEVVDVRKKLDQLEELIKREEQKKLDEENAKKENK